MHTDQHCADLACYVWSLYSTENNMLLSPRSVRAVFFNVLFKDTVNVSDYIVYVALLRAGIE
jgi:hypothetical protein